MVNVIARLVDELGAADLRLRKAQPRGSGRLTMELESTNGSICGGQWHSDTDEARRVAALVRDRFGEDSVTVLGSGQLLVQHGGSDRKLPAVRRVLSGDGAELVAHRPERRAVVKVSATRYVKIVRPGRTGDVVEPLLQVRPDSLRIPAVQSADDRRGLVTVTAVPGRTLLECLSDPRSDDEQLVVDLLQVGASIRQLHAHPTALSRPVHDRAVDVAAAHRWLAAATDHGLLDKDAWEGQLDRAAAQLPASPSPPVLLHRDLHDKQIVLATGRPVGLLDLDLATHGDPAVDLANLLTHLDLRSRQGLCSVQRAARCSTALLEGYSPGPALLQRLPPYVAITRLRLAGLYSFRPARAGLVAGLLHDCWSRSDPEPRPAAAALIPQDSPKVGSPSWRERDHRSPWQPGKGSTCDMSPPPPSLARRSP